MDARAIEASLRRIETMAAHLIACVRAGEWAAAASLDNELHATLSDALACVDASDSRARRQVVASLEHIKLGYDDAYREIEAARERLAAERSDALHVHRQIGRYLQTAAG